MGCFFFSSLTVQVFILLKHRYLEMKGEIHQVNRPPDTAADLTRDDVGSPSGRYSMAHIETDGNGLRSLRRGFLSGAGTRNGAQMRGGLMSPLLPRTNHNDSNDSMT